MEALTVDKTIKHILERPEAARARIAEALIASLDETPGPEVERAWQEEIARRVREVDTGKVKCIPWEEVRTRLYQNAKANRCRTSRGLRGGRRVTLMV